MEERQVSVSVESILINIRVYFKKIFCRHDYRFNTSIHGDFINKNNGDRSVWQCKKCGKLTTKQAYIDKNYINEMIYKSNISKGEISDGYHTFNELYYHRMILFSIICNQNKNISWKSKLHSDGSMFKDYFIVGITTPDGEYTYHYHMDYWNKFEVDEIQNAPMWDGHKPSDITRLYGILK